MKKTILVSITSLALCLSSCIDNFIPRDGSVETIAPSFLGNDAVSIDKKGNVYVSEYGAFENTGGNGTRIFKITTDGVVSEFVTGLQGPVGNTIDSKGNIYVCDGNNFSRGNVIKIAETGEKTLLATITGYPSGITLDKNGNIFVTNYLLPVIHKITPSGEISEFANDERLAGCVGVDFDTLGNLITGNFTNADILSVNTNGEVTLVANIPNITFDNFAVGYITVMNDFVYATGIVVNKIFEISLKTGTINELVGTGERATIDGDFDEAAFFTPNGIASDSKNKVLYVSENGSLRKIYLPIVY